MFNLIVNRCPVAVVFPALGLVLLALSGCGGSSGNGTPMVQSTGQFAGLTFTASTEKSVPYTVPFTITYTLVNSGSAPLSVAVPALFLDATVNSGTSTVWQFSKSTGVLEGWMLETLQPGKTISGSVNWNQVDGEGNHVPPGNYSISAWSPIGSVSSASYTSEQAQADFAAPPVTVTVK